MGDRHAPEGWIDGYDTVDLTVSRLDVVKKGITLRGGVKNMFDDNIVYLTDRQGNLFKDAFGGRTWWLQVSYDF